MPSKEEMAEKLGLRRESCDRCGKPHAKGKLYKCGSCGAVLCHQQVVKQETTNLLYHMIDPGAEKKRRGVSHLDWPEIVCGPVKEFLVGIQILDGPRLARKGVETCDDGKVRTTIWKCCLCHRNCDRIGYKRRDGYILCPDCVAKLENVTR